MLANNPPAVNDSCKRNKKGALLLRLFSSPNYCGTASMLKKRIPRLFSYLCANCAIVLTMKLHRFNLYYIYL
jgi:hypothetical protein